MGMHVRQRRCLMPGCATAACCVPCDLATACVCVLTHLVALCVCAGDTVFALVVTAPHAAYEKDSVALKHIQDTFQLL